MCWDVLPKPGYVVTKQAVAPFDNYIHEQRQPGTFSYIGVRPTDRVIQSDSIENYFYFMPLLKVGFVSTCVESRIKTMARRHRWSRGLKNVDMIEWLGASTDTRDDDDAVGSPFALLSASAYVITRIQLHAGFSIFFQACTAQLGSRY